MAAGEELAMHVYGSDMHVSGIVPLTLVPGKGKGEIKGFSGYFLSLSNI